MAGWETFPDPSFVDPPAWCLGGPFVFDRVQHEAVLHRFVATFDAVRATLPIDPPVPPGRRRWWRR